MRVLISGAGIAGPTLAYWLAHYGLDPTIVEKAPGMRTGGYIIDFWGAGFDVADRMGLLPEIRRKGYIVRQVRVVNGSGRKVAGFPVDVFARLARDRYVSLSRSDLAASILGKIEGRVETIFGDSITWIEQTEKAVRVRLEHGAEREFDLVVGADGLHSRVRELVFGPEKRFEKYLGYKVAAFEIEGYRPRDELTYVMYTQVHKQVVRFATRDNRTMFLFTFADDEIVGMPAGSRETPKAILQKHFGNSGWECPHILDALDRGSHIYFDRVSQIRMDDGHRSWSRGRVTLLGDAACGVSLLAGQGAALAMIAAYILAGELRRAGGDPREAFSRYQQLFGPFVLKKQNSALRLAGAFAPKSRVGLFLRNQIMNLLSVPWVADRAFGRDLMDRLVLPEY